MFFFGKSELEEKEQELRELRKDYAVEKQHRNEVELLKENHKNKVDELETTIAAKDAIIEAHKNQNANIEEKLKYEKDNRDAIIDARVQQELGKYETRYYHDLHTGLESRSDKMQKFQEDLLTKLLDTLKEMKPAEPKTLILGKEVFGAEDKAKGGNQNQQKQD